MTAIMSSCAFCNSNGIIIHLWLDALRHCDELLLYSRTAPNLAFKLGNNEPRWGVAGNRRCVCGHNKAAAHLFQSKRKRMQIPHNLKWLFTLSPQSVCQALEIGNAVIDSGVSFVHAVPICHISSVCWWICTKMHETPEKLLRMEHMTESKWKMSMWQRYTKWKIEFVRVCEFMTLHLIFGQGGAEPVAQVFNRAQSNMASPSPWPHCTESHDDSH